MKWIGIAALAGALTAGLFAVGSAMGSRNSAGTMAAVNGPYTAGSVISSSVINARLADIENELTLSLSTQAKGGMVAALRGTDGTVTAPAFSFTSETGTGLYRIGSSDLGVAINQSKKLELTSSLFTIVPNVSLTGYFSSSVGIGAAPASNLLEITGSSEPALAVMNTTMTGSPSAYFGMNNGNSAGLLQILKASGSPSLPWKFYTLNSGTATLALTLPAAGGVIVGASGSTISQLTTGTGTFNGGTPATFTATVASGAKCVASKVQTGGAAAVAVSVTTTTLTVTSSAAGDVSTANYFCF